MCLAVQKQVLKNEINEKVKETLNIVKDRFLLKQGKSNETD